MIDFEYNLRGVLHLFFKQKKKLLIVFFIIFIPGFIWVSGKEPYYETKGSILLKFSQNEHSEVSLLGQNPVAKTYANNERKETLQSYVKILQSPDLIIKVIASIGADKVYPSLKDSQFDETQKLQKAAEIVADNLSVSAGVDNYLIEIYFKHDDPQIAAEVTKQLMEKFKERHTEIYETPQINFLEVQAEEAQKKLDESRAVFIDFKKSAGISEIDKEIDQLLRQKNDLLSITYKTVTEAQETLAAMEAKEAEMRATYRSNSPVIKSLRESIAVAKNQLRQRQSDMTATSGSEGSLASQTAIIDERITWLEEQRGRYNELERKVRLDEDNTEYYRQRMEEARVNYMLNAQDITRISTVDEPAVPLRPSGPNKALMLIAIVMFASILAAAIAILYELTDDRFSFPNQIRSRLGLPVLATFSKAEGV